MGQNDRSASLQQDYIARIDFDSGTQKSQISLNLEDDTFFVTKILTPYPHNVADIPFLRASNKRLLTASETAYKYLKNALSGFGDDLKPDLSFDPMGQIS
jgi:hypothetical protein